MPKRPKSTKPPSTTPAPVQPRSVICAHDPPTAPSFRGSNAARCTGWPVAHQFTWRVGRPSAGHSPLSWSTKPPSTTPASLPQHSATSPLDQQSCGRHLRAPRSTSCVRRLQRRRQERHRSHRRCWLHRHPDGAVPRRREFHPEQTASLLTLALSRPIPRPLGVSVHRPEAAASGRESVIALPTCCVSLFDTPA